MDRAVGPEAAKNYPRRLAEGFFDKYLSGDAVLDIGFRGGDPESIPITDKAIGVELDYPGYDGRTLPFADESQDAVFVSHCLEHIEDYSDVLADWYRVLKVHGFLIIAVPHKELYERKASLPSRFNPDHKRFYTPRSLLTEIEEALPLGGYRIRSLRDIDDGFDYSLPPEQHATGSYEIELVLQKIEVPFYIERLRIYGVAASQILSFVSGMVVQAIIAYRAGREVAASEVQAVLERVPLPPFRQLVTAVASEAKSQEPPITHDELARILRPIILNAEFDEASYLDRYKEVKQAVEAGHFASGHEHYVRHGYIEGRLPMADDLMRLWMG